MLADDTPLFDGVYDYSALCAGGSIEAAAHLCHGQADIAINWSGGLHHAKKYEASGFCYVNDIVLAILELLTVHQRVLYIDIDVHHGDGVEEAFYTTDRVLTLSFHKYGGGFFPGTGALLDGGVGPGKGYSFNFPLRQGISDFTYETIFKPTVEKIVSWYRPESIVLQSGADSLAADRLGCFNLSSNGHGKCVEYVKSLGLPMLLLGGGGYTVKNVSRCWAYETAVALGQEISEVLPECEYYEYFGPNYRLKVDPTNMTDMNTPQYLQAVAAKVFEQMRNLPHAPSVAMQKTPFDQSYVDRMDTMDDADEDQNKDTRNTQRQVDRRTK